MLRQLQTQTAVAKWSQQEKGPSQDWFGTDMPDKREEKPKVVLFAKESLLSSVKTDSLHISGGLLEQRQPIPGEA
jgi:hypothetical protein